MKYLKYILLIEILVFMSACEKDDLSDTSPFIILRADAEFTPNGAFIPIGAQMKFGISAVGDGAAITNLTVKRITGSGTITELDRGLFIESGGLDTTLSYVKGSAEQEIWKFFIMNSHRDTASISLTIYKGAGSAYGDIDYFPSINIAYQNNNSLPCFADLHTGNAYDKTAVAGNESSIDLISYYYISSGKSSPTLSCPGYPSAAAYYPQMNDWAVKNSVVYDYYTTDNDLLSTSQFDAAQNDSLLVNAYLPGNVSGTCKFCYTGKVIPFKTANGKYGLIKVIKADEVDTGSIEIAVKIQK